MTKQEKLAIQRNRYVTLSGNPKNIKSTGVVKKIARQLRNAGEIL